MIPSKDPTQLSLLFHLNSEPWTANDAKSDHYDREYRHLENVVARVSLPSVGPSNLSELIRERKSQRHFEPTVMPQSSLSAILMAAYGAFDNSTRETDEPILRRSVPSGGGMYPLEIYLFLQSVDGLEDGLYHYDVIGHSLELMSAGNKSAQLQAAFYSYSFMINANVVLCHTAVFLRMQKKYGPRGYRYILLEAGHSAQNICLTATELGLGSLCIGGFKDSVLNRILEIAPQEEGVVYSVAVG